MHRRWSFPTRLVDPWFADLVDLCCVHPGGDGSEDRVPLALLLHASGCTNACDSSLLALLVQVARRQSVAALVVRLLRIYVQRLGTCVACLHCACPDTVESAVPMSKCADEGKNSGRKCAFCNFIFKRGVFDLLGER